MGMRVSARVALSLLGRLIAILVVVVAIAAGYRWWASEERAIRHQLSEIAQSLTVIPNEADLGSVGRIARLRKALAPDIRIVAAEPLDAASSDAVARVTQHIVGRDAVLALVRRWVPPPGGVTVEFLDVKIEIDDGRTDAQVRCTARITSRESQQAAIDAQELTIGFTNVEGDWLVTSVRSEQATAG
jgi:hypothetical protein